MTAVLVPHHEPEGAATGGALRAVLVGYTGTPASLHALEAAALLDPARTYVATVAPRTGGFPWTRRRRAQEAEAAARASADEGCALARALGLTADPVTRTAGWETGVAGALALLAVDTESDAIVVGRGTASRGVAAALQHRTMRPLLLARRPG